MFTGSALQQVVDSATIFKPQVPPKPRSRFTPEMFNNVPCNYRAGIRAFLCEDASYLTPSSPYKLIDGELWFVRPKNRGGRRWGVNKSLVARKINGEFFANSSEIWARREGHKQSTSHRAKELAVQRHLSKFIPMVPYVLFQDTGLDIEQLKVIDRGPIEELDFGFKANDGSKILQHFTGAMLFELGGQQFIFDIDRNELKLKQFNAWMSKLPVVCSTIAEAYAALKPAEVYEAEKFLGRECQRQGEWFFIPVTGDFKVDREGLKGTTGWGANMKYVAVLQAKGNRAHYVDEISKEGYVRGTVTHGGYEHKPIKLTEWCKPVPNAAVESYKISGMVD